MTSSNIAVIALVFLAGLVLGGAAIWLVGRRKLGPRTAPPTHPTEKPAADLSFRWSYIALPAAIALVTVVAIAVLYSSLPAEVIYRFSSSGAPRDTISREVFAVLMIGVQIAIVGAAGVIALLILKIARRMLQNNPPPVEPRRTVWLMVNMLALPQLIVAFIALDAAYYARAGSHIMTPWLFSLLVIGIGTLVIIFLFAQSLNEARSPKAD